MPARRRCTTNLLLVSSSRTLEFLHPLNEIQISVAELSLAAAAAIQNSPRASARPHDAILKLTVVLTGDGLSVHLHVLNSAPYSPDESSPKTLATMRSQPDQTSIPS